MQVGGRPEARQGHPEDKVGLARPQGLAKGAEKSFPGPLSPDLRVAGSGPDLLITTLAGGVVPGRVACLRKLHHKESSGTEKTVFTQAHTSPTQDGQTPVETEGAIPVSLPAVRPALSAHVSHEDAGL